MTYTSFNLEKLNLYPLRELVTEHVVRLEKSPYQKKPIIETIEFSVFHPSHPNHKIVSSRFSQRAYSSDPQPEIHDLSHAITSMTYPFNKALMKHAEAVNTATAKGYQQALKTNFSERSKLYEQSLTDQLNASKNNIYFEKRENFLPLGPDIGSVMRADHMEDKGLTISTMKKYMLHPQEVLGNKSLENLAASHFSNSQLETEYGIFHTLREIMKDKKLVDYEDPERRTEYAFCTMPGVLEEKAKNYESILNALKASENDSNKQGSEKPVHYQYPSSYFDQFN